MININENEDNINEKALFFELLGMLNVAIIQNLGLMKNPITKEKKKNLEVVKNTIDLLLMLREKTKENLDKEEKEALNEVISNGQILYVREQGKGDNKSSDEPAE